MKRRSHWGQDSPIIQLKVLLGSIEGELSNIREGIASDKAPGRAIAMIQDAQTIAEAIDKGDNVDGTKISYSEAERLSDEALRRWLHWALKTDPGRVRILEECGDDREKC